MVEGKDRAVNSEYTLIAEYPGGGGLWVPTHKIDQYSEYDRRDTRETENLVVTHEKPADLKHQIASLDSPAN